MFMTYLTLSANSFVEAYRECKKTIQIGKSDWIGILELQTKKWKILQTNVMSQYGGIERGAIIASLQLRCQRGGSI